MFLNVAVDRRGTEHLAFNLWDRSFDRFVSFDFSRSELRVFNRLDRSFDRFVSFELSRSERGDPCLAFPYPALAGASSTAFSGTESRILSKTSSHSIPSA